MFKYHQDLICFNQTEIVHDGLQLFFLDKYSSYEGTWELLKIRNGEIDVVFLSGDETELSRHRLNRLSPPILIPPASWHKIVPVSKSYRAVLEFYCKSHRYFNKKHNLDPVQSDLLTIYRNYFQGSEKLDVLDVGCGWGRNLLFLALEGHQATGVDSNHAAIQKIEHLAKQENLLNIATHVHDLHKPLGFGEESFDLIVSTVCLQFINEQRIPSLITELQGMTRPDGAHFLAFPLRCDAFSSLPFFNFLPTTKELFHIYQDSGWSIIEYQESFGRLHKLNNENLPIQGMFAILLAQKIEGKVG